MTGVAGEYGGPEAPGAEPLPGPPGPAALYSGAPYPPYEPYSGLRGLAGWTGALLIATAIAVGVVFLSEVAGVSELSPDAGETAADATGEQVLIGALLGFIEGGLYIAAVVLFMIWFHRAYRNLRPLGVERPRYGTGWAIGAWFIPVFNYIRPKQIVNDIWRASGSEAPPDQGDGWRREPIPAVYRYWWTAWIGVAVIGIAASVVLVAQGEGSVLSEALYYLSYLVTIAAALLARSAVRQTTERQESRARKLGWIRA
jgi:hypothetical protein